jgi:hypothetical protein
MRWEGRRKVRGVRKIADVQRTDQKNVDQKRVMLMK